MIDPSTFREWFPRLQAALGLGPIRRARFKGPANLVVVFLRDDRVYVWASEVWVRDHPEAAGLLDELVAVFRAAGYHGDWVDTPVRNLRKRLSTSHWPAQWYQQDLVRLDVRQRDRQRASSALGQPV